MNLLRETTSALAENHKTTADVRWVGSSDGAYAVPWEAFAVIADVEYDDGFGSQEIAPDLVVVGDGWWLERGEYDGSEWWDFKSPPTVAADPHAFATVKNGMGSSLAKANP